MIDEPDFMLADDLCVSCGALLDYFGECPNGCKQTEEEDE